MKSILGALFIFLFLTPMAVNGQQGPPQAREFMESWVGDWTYVVGEGSGTYSCAWLGEAFVQCDERYTAPDGTVTDLLGVWGYDAEAEHLTWNRFWGNGANEFFGGSRDGETWVFVSDEVNGVRTRLILNPEFGGSVPFFWEESRDGGDWVRVLDGRMTRAG